MAQLRGESTAGGVIIATVDDLKESNLLLKEELNTRIGNLEEEIIDLEIELTEMLETELTKMQKSIIIETTALVESEVSNAKEEILAEAEGILEQIKKDLAKQIEIDVRDEMRQFGDDFYKFLAEELENKLKPINEKLNELIEASKEIDGGSF